MGPGDTDHGENEPLGHATEGIRMDTVRVLTEWLSTSPSTTVSVPEFDVYDDVAMGLHPRVDRVVRRLAAWPGCGMVRSPTRGATSLGR